ANPANPYQLILMDCQMPEMDGYQATRRIRAGEAGDSYKNITIVAMTANAMAGDREKCLDAGMNDYLSKPVEPNELLRKLSTNLLNKNEDSIELVDYRENSDELRLVIWDKKSALKRTMGRVDRLKLFIDLFFKEYPALIEAIFEATKNKDLEKVRFSAHTLKGISANLSGLKLQAKALEVESAAKSNEQCIVESLLGELEEEIQALLDEFNRFING
ncbi:MAG: response regulator, partial [Kangiellaceae bacterium]|nr:response regulator [Kangiellaceae bacterium]